jgi:hypothetical protein
MPPATVLQMTPRYKYEKEESSYLVGFGCDKTVLHLHGFQNTHFLALHNL